MFYVKLKEDIKEAYYFAGDWVHPNKDFVAYDERFRKEIENHRDFDKLIIKEQEYMDELADKRQKQIDDTVNGQWKQSEKRINGINDIKLLKDMLMSAEEAGRTKIVEILTDRIEELSGIKNI